MSDEKLLEFRPITAAEAAEVNAANADNVRFYEVQRTLLTFGTHADIKAATEAVKRIAAKAMRRKS